jgi:hypothetical protein
MSGYDDRMDKHSREDCIATKERRRQLNDMMASPERPASLLRPATTVIEVSELERLRARIAQLEAGESAARGGGVETPPDGDDFQRWWDQNQPLNPAMKNFGAFVWGQAFNAGRVYTPPAEPGAVAVSMSVKDAETLIYVLGLAHCPNYQWLADMQERVQAALATKERP